MKRLLDHHLSYKLVGCLADLCPDAAHVRTINLHAADDRTVWGYARANGFAIASIEEDFHQLSCLDGAPPKVVWVRLGHCTTADIEHALRRHLTDVSNFDATEEGACLIVGIRRAEPPSGADGPQHRRFRSLLAWFAVGRRSPGSCCACGHAWG
jgi:predicted nuclease of predicted toxin-antitoxin system